MGYKVKWVEENLGVTRKALRGFEKAGLMPENKDRQYRDYDDDDIDRIWTIRVLQGMGYSLKEIADMVTDEDFDFDDSIAQKVLELEEEKKKIERHLGYARTIKLTGRFPSRPKKMGKVKFEEFQNKAIEGWNIMDDPQSTEYAKLAETILSKSPEEWDNTDLGRMISSLESVLTLDVDLLLAEYVLPKAIIKKRNLGADHPDIQFMIKMIYENQNALGAVYGMEGDMTVKQFSRFYSSSYLSGDVAKLKTRDYIKEECEFIAEAVAIFGGYKNYDELIEEELRYGR
nr:MerR family transcriptional regulator [uncultured Blautia sp.]